MKLVPIEQHPDAPRILYDLLAERPAIANISHRQMPTWTAHETFVWHHPYRSWNLIGVEGEIVGAIYLSMQDEIGIGIFKQHQRKGYARQAIGLLMQEFGPRRYLANIAPRNEASRKMFERLGFRMIQQTFELTDAD